MKRTSWILFGWLALFVSNAVAGQYKLVEGEGLDVCEAYQKNLEARHDDEPMACERQYDPAIKGFASPRWKRLDLKKHLDLYKQAEIYTQENIAHGITEEGLQESLKYLEMRTKSLKSELYLTRLDLDGDGHRDNVLAIREPTCGPHHEAGMRTRIYVLNATLSGIDQPRMDRWQDYYNNATIELYKGKPYVEAYEPDHDWGQLLTGSGALHVFMRAVSAGDGTRRR